MGFLTLLDKRAQIKGSRDPLGVQSIWIGFGREIIGNLTNASNSVLSFKTLLLGYYFIAQAKEKGIESSPVSVFLKWEQLVAYSRYIINRDQSFRGIEKVSQKVAEDKSQLTISDSKDSQILSNQQVYGVWGLFSVSSLNSGLIEMSPPRLKDYTKEFIESEYINKLVKKNENFLEKILKILTSKRTEISTDKSKNLLEEIASLFTSKFSLHEKEFFRAALIFRNKTIPDSTLGRQALLAKILGEAHAKTEFVLSRSSMLNLVDRAQKLTTDHGLTQSLKDICICESVLAPGEALFDYMMSSNDQQINSLTKNVHEEWGSGVPNISSSDFKKLEEKLTSYTGNKDLAALWVKLSEMLANGKYEDAINLLIEINATVMNFRGSSGAWISIDDDRLKVKSFDQGEGLRSKEDLPDLWKNPYFIGSFYTIMKELGL